jgi:hypothetical protein
MFSIFASAFFIVFRTGNMIGRFQADINSIKGDIKSLEENAATKDELSLVQTSTSDMIKSLVVSIGDRISGLEDQIRSLHGQSV